MGKPDIIEVTESSFEYDVIAFSQNTPVVVDFWAEWCKPCKTLGIILEKLAIEFNGGFRLARVNIDQNPNLAIRFQVRSIPTLKVFVNAQVTGELVGLQEESKVKEFLGQIAPPSPLMLLAEKGEAQLKERSWKDASLTFDELLKNDPENSQFKVGMAMALIGLGKPYQSSELLETITSGRVYTRAQALLELTQAQKKVLEQKESTESTLDMAYVNCIRFTLKQQFEPAMDGLLDIIRQEKNYKNGQARRVFLAILEVIYGNEEAVRSYRADLGKALF